MFVDHQTPREEAERPEGSLKDLAGEFVSDARWNPSHPQGPGLYADAKVFEHWRPFIEELAPNIGVSIRASGRAKPGEVEGKRVPVIEELVSARSVDFVTSPGAGGQIMTLFESARARAQQAITNGGEGDVDEIKIQEAVAAREAAETKLREATDKITALEAEKATSAAELARLKEGELQRQAAGLVDELLPKQVEGIIPGVWDLTRARLAEALPAQVVVKDGALDKDATKEIIEKAVKDEMTYLAKITESGKVRNLGAGPASTDAETIKALEESFRGLGLSESAAKIAAVGR